MERRMKGGYLDQQVPYTFCSVSAALASTPAPACTPPLPATQPLPRGSSGVQGLPARVAPGPQSHPPDQPASG